MVRTPGVNSLQLERAGAVRLGEVGRAVLDDVEVERAEDDGQVGIGRRQRDLHLDAARSL